MAGSLKSRRRSTSSKSKKSRCATKRKSSCVRMRKVKCSWASGKKRSFCRTRSNRRH